MKLFTLQHQERNMQKSRLAIATLAAAIGMAVISTTPIKAEGMGGMNKDMGNMEKCYGIVKAHQNDCKTAAHACAGHASLSRDKSDFVMIPAGLCKKIDGGSTRGT